jgi:hypothetical protein
MWARSHLEGRGSRRAAADPPGARSPGPRSAPRSPARQTGDEGPPDASRSTARRRRCPRTGRGRRARPASGTHSPPARVRRGRPTGRAPRLGARPYGLLRQLQLGLFRGQALRLFLNAPLILLDPLLIRIDGHRGRRRGRGRARLRRRTRQRQDAHHDDRDADQYPLLQVTWDDAQRGATPIRDGRGICRRLARGKRGV